MALLKELIESRNIEGLKAFMKEHDLVVKDGKIVPRNEEVKNKHAYLSGFWNQRQQARKILLNSLYGALLNVSCRFYDERMGQSTTLSGRSVVRHMNATTNEVITGVYDYTGAAIVYADTDSVAADSVVQSSIGPLTIEKLFDNCRIKWQVDDKEYAVDDRFSVLGLDNTHARFSPMHYIYRHRTSKRRFRITDCLGNKVVVTEDHSIMVERDGRLIGVKPINLCVGDTVLSLSDIT